ILTLADGSKVILDNTHNGVVANQGNIQVDKRESGELVYHANDSANAVLKTQFNSISTPVGSQYQVSLSDGSKVWLNALSTIKYPTAFTGDERVVQLTGEAYFEVEKNKSKPFKVILANNTSVEVLGTHFDVMAYTDEKDIDATLLEGSIKVSKGDKNKTIIPGEQAKVNDDIKVSTVNAEEAIAWKNGLFSFDRSDTQSIMRQIGRWYGVDIIYQGKVPDNQFTGYIARTSNLSEVLKMLEVSGVKSTLKNNRITITNE
ncbi:MAG TPA: FecR domain-containing protein, partial [Mucilaginibacter sp.]